VQDRLVGPSVVFSNGHIADERVLGRFVQEVEEFEEATEESG